MTAVTNKVFKGDENWLTKEHQKFESFVEDSIQKFSTECQQEFDWLRKYLQDIIRATKVEISKEKGISSQVTENNIICDASSGCNNVEVSTIVAQQTKRLVTKRTPRSKYEKPEIKSLILAAAAAKKEQEKQEKRIIKAKELEIARQRAKEKNVDLIKKKKVDRIQDNSGENILHRKKPEILEQIKIPSNVQSIEQLKQFCGKTHVKTLHTEKQSEILEIDSDYSSDEEVKTKRQQRKDWEQSPELKAALIRQASIDPETIFGKISSLNIDEIFRGREYKLRPRSSSANWSGLDALTEEEELEYKKRMGFL